MTPHDLFDELRLRGPIVAARTNADGTAVFGRERRRHAVGRPGAKLIAGATILLFVLGIGLLAVSFAAQYRYVLHQRHQPTASLIEAGALDIAMVIFSFLALGLARAGLAAKAERMLIVVCAAGSALMNYAAADVASPRSVLAFVMPPMFLAVVVDRVVVSVRRHVLGMQDGRSPWTLLARTGLYGARFVLDPWRTAKGLRRHVLAAAPLPGAAPTEPLLSLPQAPQAGTALQPAGTATTRRVTPPGKVTKTARFLALVEKTHGPLPSIPAARVSPIAAELAPKVGLHAGAARTALGKAVHAAQNGGQNT